jgi:hypothetical protein
MQAALLATQTDSVSMMMRWIKGNNSMAVTACWFTANSAAVMGLLRQCPPAVCPEKRLSSIWVAALHSLTGSR